MPYPACTPDEVARFEAEGFLVVADAIDPAEVETFAERCSVILAKKEKLAFDWAWEKGTPKERRAFRIVQGSPTLVWPAIARTRARAWMLGFAAALLRRPVEFWYDQYLAKPPRDGVLPHRQPPHVQSDLLCCEPDLARAVACPIPVGAVTFHHGKTPHMTPANRSDGWRCAVTTHIRVAGSAGEGDHYPWKVYVNQLTGERIVPPSR